MRFKIEPDKNITIPNDVTSIGGWAFDYCSKLENIYYSGSKEDWEKLIKDSDNDALTNVNIYFNSRLKESRVSDKRSNMKLLIENSSKNEIIKEAKDTNFSINAGKKYKTPTGFTLRITSMHIYYDPVKDAEPDFFISGYLDFLDKSKPYTKYDSIGWSGNSMESFKKAYMMTKEEFIEKWIEQNPNPNWGSPKHAIEIADRLGFILDTSEDTYPKYTLRSK